MLIAKEGFKLAPNKCIKCQAYAMARETSALKLKFYLLLEIVIKQFTRSGVCPADMLKFLPDKIASQLEGAATIKEIFSVTGALDSALSWYSFEVLEDLVRQFGDIECKQKKEDYIKALQAFLHSRRCYLSSKTSTSASIMVLVDSEWDENLIRDKEKSAYIATLLGTTKTHITFIQV